MCFWAYFECNLLNICQSKKCSKTNCRDNWNAHFNWMRIGTIYMHFLTCMFSNQLWSEYMQRLLNNCQWFSKHANIISFFPPECRYLLQTPECHDLCVVTIDGLCIGEWIYIPLTSIHTLIHTSQITTAPAKLFPVCCVFTSRSLAVASNSGDSSALCAQVLS
jgi:hypothetical protein